MPEFLERIYNRPVLADVSFGQIVLGVIAVVIVIATWNAIVRARMLK